MTHRDIEFIASQGSFAIAKYLDMFLRNRGVLLEMVDLKTINDKIQTVIGHSITVTLNTEGIKIAEEKPGNDLVWHCSHGYQRKLTDCVKILSKLGATKSELEAEIELKSGKKRLSLLTEFEAMEVLESLVALADQMQAAADRRQAKEGMKSDVSQSKL